MDIATLRRNLTIQPDGSLSISAGTVTTEKFRQFFATVFDDATLQLSHATHGSDDSGNTVQIVGTALAFLRVDNLPVTATFILNPDTGEVFANLCFMLTGNGRQWRFSDSYPDLPCTFDFTTGLTTPQTSPLDDLPLESAWFYAITDDTTIHVDVNGKPEPLALKAGLAFAGVLALNGIVLALDHLIRADSRFAIAGHTVPPGRENTPPLRDAVNNFPWREQSNPPGITLVADLGLQVSISNVLTLQKTQLSVYSPISAAWWQANPSYEPFMALGGQLTIPSADITMDLSSKIPKGLNKLVITDEFTGVSFDKLADLLDIAGTDTLIDLFPQPLKNSINKVESELKKLQLLDAAIAFSSSGAGVTVDYVYLTVGIPDADWTLLDGAFTLDSITAQFFVATPFNHPAPSVTVDAKLTIEGAKVDLEAGYPGFFVAGTLEEQFTIPLRSFIEKYVGVAPPADLTINALTVNIDEQSGFNFYTEMADTPGWTIPLGKHSLTIEDVQFGFSKGVSSSSKVSAQFAGGLVFDDSLILAMSYDPTAGFTMRGDFPQVTLNGLIGWLTSVENVLPAGFGDIAFEDSTLVITKNDSTFELYFGTEIGDIGSFAFVLLNDSNGWSFAFGIDLRPGKLLQLPGLSGIAPFLKIFPIQGQQVVIFSTLQNAGFAFPAMEVFQNPRIQSSKIQIPQWAGGLQKGFYFYAQTSLSDNPTLRNLACLLDISSQTSLDAGIFIGTSAATDARLFAGITTTIDNSVQLTGQLGVQWQGSTIEFYMTGTAHCQIQRQPVRFDISLAVMENGAFVSGDMVVEGGRNTIDFSVFKLQQLALELGISFEGVPSLGFAATLDINDIDSAVAVFVDTADPAKSMVAGSVSDLTLAKAFSELTGAAAPLPDFLEDVLAKIGVGGLHNFSSNWTTYHDALNNYQLDSIRAMFAAGSVVLSADSGQIQLIVNTKDQSWYLLDLSTMYHYELVRNGDTIDVSLEAQLYAVPEAVTIATLNFQQGFHIFGEIDYLLIKEQIAVEIFPTKGIGFMVDISPIVIGSGKLFSLTGANGQGGPTLVLCTFNDAGNPDPNFREPVFKVSGEAYILGINPQVDITINANQFHLELKDWTRGGSRFSFTVDFAGLDTLEAQGSASVGINTSIDFGSLGSLSIDDTIDASLNFGKNTNDIYAHAAFGFTLAGESYTIAPFDLNIDTGPLADLPGVIIEKIKAFFMTLFQDANKWLEYVLKGILNGFEDIKKVGQVLVQVFHLAEKAVVQLMQAVGYPAEQVVEVLVDAFNETLEEAENIVNFFYNQLKNCTMKTGLLAA